MEESQMKCPNCDTFNAPILIVRGNGVDCRGVSLQCRKCHHEWVAEELDYQGS